MTVQTTPRRRCAKVLKSVLAAEGDEVETPALPVTNPLGMPSS
jgi:hypothetical protein